MREHVRFVICLAALGGSWAEDVCISASNAVRFTNHIYGCDVAWSSPGVASASAVCGSAAHICTSLEEIQARGLADGGCTSMAPEGKAYLTLLAGSSMGAVGDCSQASSRGSNDIWACAKDGNGVSWRHGGSCGALDRIVGDGGTSKAGFSWASHMDELGGMMSDGSSGGVLCCSDDPTTVLTASALPESTGAGSCVELHNVQRDLCTWQEPPGMGSDAAGLQACRNACDADPACFAIQWVIGEGWCNTCTGGITMAEWATRVGGDAEVRSKACWGSGSSSVPFVVRPSPLELSPRHRPAPPLSRLRRYPLPPPLSPAPTPGDDCPSACTARRSPPNP